MRGVCALNMEALTMFRGSQGCDDGGGGGGGDSVDGANTHTNKHGSDSGDDGGKVVREPASAPAENIPSIDPPNLPRFTPSQSAPPPTGHRGNQTNIPQTHSSVLPSQPAHVTPHTLTTSHHNGDTVTASLVNVQTLQARDRSKGRSLVGVASHRKGCGRSKPVVMIERHSLA